MRLPRPRLNEKRGGVLHQHTATLTVPGKLEVRGHGPLSVFAMIRMFYRSRGRPSGSARPPVATAAVEA
jgi:hypothetical protein